MENQPTQSDKTAMRKNAIIEALKKSLGNVSFACNTVGINRDTYYEWLRNDPDFAQTVKSDVFEHNIDFVESKLMEKINGKEYIEETKEYDKKGNVKTVKQSKKTVLPDTEAIKFFLKTRGKERGYVEKTELLHDITENTAKGLRSWIIEPK